MHERFCEHTRVILFLVSINSFYSHIFGRCRRGMAGVRVCVCVCVGYMHVIALLTLFIRVP